MIPSKLLMPKVAILMATYQGGLYLEPQLDSFMSQSHLNWELWASDDGSDDNTLDTLKTYQQRWGAHRFFIKNGPRQGYCTNFLSMACQADISADYYAYSDQDDIWLADKLSRALNHLSAVPKHIPALYCSRTQVIGKQDRVLGLSPLFTKAPSFANALVQNIGGGNTMVFNEAARQLLISAGDRVNVASHDWWTYIVVSGLGGRVFYDALPTVLYRQHGSNLVGMNPTWSARFGRILLMFQGRFKAWNSLHISALSGLRDKLVFENGIILDQFAASRQSSLFQRLKGLMQSGVYRQTLFGNFSLYMAAVFNKL